MIYIYTGRAKFRKELVETYDSDFSESKNSSEIDKLQIVFNPGPIDSHPADIIEWTRTTIINRYKNLKNTDLFLICNSEHVINALRVATKKGEVKPGDAVVYHFNESGKHVLTIAENGEMTDYPDGFMDEWNNQLTELL